LMIFAFLSAGIPAEQKKEPDSKNTPEKSVKSPPALHNFEFVIQDNVGAELIAWTGQIFSIMDGKPVDKISPKDRFKHLPAGNYVLMLHFEEDIPEMKGHRPFTFTIKENHRTMFTLLIGASQELEREDGVGRTGADFVASDPRRGRDYVNFELPAGAPELCLAKCKKDPNCDAYSYGKLPEWPKARCWLIHGAAVAEPSPYAVSGVIQRDSSPYQVQITIEKLEPKK
jgi:hypothetical protein